MRKLSEQGISKDAYIILEKGSYPISQIKKIVGDIGDIQDKRIKITYFAGEKPGKNSGEKSDTEKMDWVNNSLKTFYDEHNIENVITQQTIPAMATSDTLMSGTGVRKSVYETYKEAGMDEFNGFRLWESTYPMICDFYGGISEEIYNKILEPIKDLSKDTQESYITHYIETGKILTISAQKRATKKKREETKSPETKKRTTKSRTTKKRSSKSSETSPIVSKSSETSPIAIKKTRATKKSPLKISKGGNKKRKNKSYKKTL